MRWSWLGWICQARCTTARAPAKAAASFSTASGAPTSQECHSTPSYGSPASGPGNRRATPTSSAPDSRRSRRSSAVPTLPVAPTITMRIPVPYPLKRTATTHGRGFVRAQLFSPSRRPCVAARQRGQT
ncbi:hypothetical protein GCM10027452_05970 [Micromonospora halotolerans]